METDYTPEQLQETHDTFSDELKDFILERIDRTTLNWLVQFGVPQTPAEVKTLVASVYRGGSALLLLEGHATLTDKGRASEEEEAEARRLREEQAARLSQFNEALTGNGILSAAKGNTPTGQYL